MHITTRPRFGVVEGTKDELPSDLVCLGKLIANLPAEHRALLESAYCRVAESTRRRRRILYLAQEALSQLRLNMKYLIFDLEATRRERDEWEEAFNKLDEDENWLD